MLRAAALALAASCCTGIAQAGEELSDAEVSLFLTDHFKSVSVPSTLRYTFNKRGSLEEGFSDSVEISVARARKGNSKTMSTRCLSGAKKIELPPVEQAEGNPAVLCFLERDIREMERLTGGKSNYFRKRIRLALADNAEIRPVKLSYGGKQIDGKEIRISPYLNDPLRERFDKYAGKYYVFTLSTQIPGGIYEIDAIVPELSKDEKNSGEQARLIEEVLTFTRSDMDRKKN